MLEINKIYLGDCLKIMKEFDDESIDLMITDPPYGMEYQSNRRINKFEPIEQDNNVLWFYDFIKEVYRVMKNNTHIYVFCNDYAIAEFRMNIEKVGFKLKRTLIWVKNNHTSGDLKGDYAHKTEFIIYAQKGRRNLNGKRDTNILNYKRVANLCHPAQKPVDLCQFLITKSSNPKEIVLDPFIGSGTTALACKELKRNFIGMELNKKYFEMAENRLKQNNLWNQ